jgi:parallel beta-helix repeat protein
MNSRAIFGAMAIMACMNSGGHAYGQASINENQTNAIYVGGSSASDSNTGAYAKPLATVQAALNKAIAYGNAGIGTKMIISPGVYREALNVSYHGSAPITIQAATTGATVIDGADVLSGWHSEGGNIFGYTWKDTVTGCPLPSGWYGGMPPVVQANEMVFVNGALMTQVMSSSQLRAGTFYVNKSTDQVQLSPPSGTDMTSAQVEISSRRQVLNVDGSSNLVFRGLTFEHGAACMNDSAAMVNGGSNILFDSDTADWNNWGGIGTSGGTRVTVENTTASYNGGPGLSSFEDTDSNWSNNETDFNNWRGAQVGLYDFAQGGTKLMRVRTATVTGQKSYYNASQGLWFDTDNENATVNGAKLVGNLVGNLQLEASQGPFTIENSTFCSGAGIQLLNSEGITFTGNTLYNNGGTTSFQNAQLFLAGDPAGRSFVNWTSGRYTTTFTTGMKIEHNNFVAVGSAQYVFNTYVSGSQWTKFIDSLSSNDNHWYNASKTSDFGTPDGHTTTLSGWRGLSGQDSGSVWESASADCGGPSSTYPDFQLLAHNAASYVSGYTMSGGAITIPLQVRNFNYGTVTLSASGLPSGVTASFGNSSLTSGNTTVTLHASKSAAYETVPITIFGVSGSRVHTVTLKVSVRPS